jgi:hypothetical protein
MGRLLEMTVLERSLGGAVLAVILRSLLSVTIGTLDSTSMPPFAAGATISRAAVIDSRQSGEVGDTVKVGHPGADDTTDTADAVEIGRMRRTLDFVASTVTIRGFPGAETAIF